MSVHHFIGAWKSATILLTALMVAVVALDPTVKVAIIAGVFVMLAQMPAFILGYITLKTARSTGHKVDGMQERLEDKNAKQGVELTQASTDLAHAQGVQQERVEARERHKE